MRTGETCYVGDLRSYLDLYIIWLTFLQSMTFRLMVNTLFRVREKLKMRIIKLGGKNQIQFSAKKKLFWKKNLSRWRERMRDLTWKKPPTEFLIWINTSCVIFTLSSLWSLVPWGSEHKAVMILRCQVFESRERHNKWPENFFTLNSFSVLGLNLSVLI